MAHVCPFAVFVVATGASESFVNLGFSLGFLNICVRDGRETYGRSCSFAWHSYVKWWPVILVYAPVACVGVHAMHTSLETLLTYSRRRRFTCAA